MKSKSRPSLNALRVFDVAARAHSFKHAAQQLGVSQSAVTRQIQTLEEQLQVRLFERDNRVHALTIAGMTLAPRLADIFQQLDGAIAQTRQVADSEVTRLRIALPNHWLRWWLRDQLHEFHALYPHIRLSFQQISENLLEQDIANTVQALQHEQLDLVMSSGRIRDRQIKSEQLCKRESVLVSRKPVVDPQAWYRRDWLVNLHQPDWLEIIEGQGQACAQTPMLHVDDNSMAMDLLQSGDYVTRLDQRLLQHPECQGLTLSNIRVHHQQAMQLYYRQRQRQPVALVALIKWLQLRAKR
ncbi:LysR family transcriptional regulator [Idiomarina xiamenensis]|uniref:LysR family transcriptional regulator n=1 Tax=Idiomarina xiamenensis 10-D-4 TaxID=740709 RepID=K2KK93_9GAMM|nr:LysR family transcriptional regulator [Idiomarina xiamenensis]EKE87052.1 LysR family transcriptional regulator [Idiomarina xiamenensis 10-D-4]